MHPSNLIVPPTLTSDEVPLLERLATTSLREAIAAEEHADTALRAAKQARAAAEANHAAVIAVLRRTKMNTAA